MAAIYQTPTMGEAHIRVAIVSDRGNADLLVCRVASFGLATGDANWFITKNKQDAKCWVYFSSVGMAQVKICFVNSFGETGWQTSHEFRGRFA